MIRNSTVQFVRTLAAMFAAAIGASGQLRPISFPSGQPAVLPSEIVTVNRHGLYPMKIVRPQGPFVLRIENRLANHDEVFSLVRDGGTALLQLTTSNGRPYDYAAMDLVPGTYHLQFKNNPKFAVELEIKN